jgi:hypothetical protein
LKTIIKSSAIIAILFVFSSCTKQLCNKTQLVDTFKKKNTALIAQDTVFLGGLASVQLSFTHSNGWIEDYKSFISSGKSKDLFYNNITIDSTYTIISNQTGIIRGSGIFDILYKKNALKVNLCFTETYTCIDNEWKLLARHSSKL